jgi:hypothetical protein
MDNDQPQTDMSDQDFIAAVKRLQAHAENQADQAFKVGDRKRFDIWDTRAAKLKGVTSIEELRESLERMGQKS